MSGLLGALAVRIFGIGLNASFSPERNAPPISTTSNHIGHGLPFLDVQPFWLGLTGAVQGFMYAKDGEVGGLPTARPLSAPDGVLGYPFPFPPPIPASASLWPLGRPEHIRVSAKLRGAPGRARAGPRATRSRARTARAPPQALAPREHPHDPEAAGHRVLSGVRPRASLGFAFKSARRL